MTIVTGKIGAARELRERLASLGIDRFNSVADLNNFLKSYETEKKGVPAAVKSAMDEELHNLETASRVASERRDKNFLNKVIYHFPAKRRARNLAKFMASYESILTRRCEQSYRRLAFIKRAVEELNPYIAGAIGENSVENEIKQLSDQFYLINDFSLRFDPPIFNKRTKDRIRSIQVDHLVVSRSGIFVLETKHWSKASLEKLDLRSPVDQIKRASFALFVFLNGKQSRKLIANHWGVKKISIRNVIVMTNAVPRSDFKHVKVLPLNQLNGYLQYFDDIYEASEVEKVFHYLNNVRVRHQ